MTNQELLELSKNLITIEELFLIKDSAETITEKVFYAIRKNLRILKPFNDEAESFRKDLTDAAKKAVKFDETKTGDKDYVERINNDIKIYLEKKETQEEYDAFLKKEVEISLYKISTEDLDECKLSSRAVFYLEKYLC